MATSREASSSSQIAVEEPSASQLSPSTSRQAHEPAVVSPESHTASQTQDGDVYVSVDRLVNYMRGNLRTSNNGNRSGGKQPTIHRVPNSLRQGCHDAYEPQLISIGPLHRRKPELKQMEQLKLKYLRDLIQREPQKDVLDAFVRTMWQQEQKVREQYSVDIDLEAGKFVEMLVLDGCFLIETFLKRATGSMGPPWGDAKWNLPMLRNDLLLLENQIPFSVLVTLFDMRFPDGYPHKPPQDGINSAPPGALTSLSVLDLALHYLKVKPEVEDPNQIHHLLHLNYICQLLNFSSGQVEETPSNILWCIPSKVGGGLKRFTSTGFFFLVSLILMCKCPRFSHSKWKKSNKYPRAIPPARELEEAGIKFKKKHEEEKERCYLNVSFDRESGELEIPFLTLQQSTVASLRNLIALEQCCSGVETHLTAYAMFMDRIIDTPRDVEILKKEGIIESKLGTDEDVADLFNNICKGATLNYQKHYLAHLFKQVNIYCDSDRQRWRAELVNSYFWRTELVNSYFHNPWVAASVIVAFTLLILTFAGTGATIWQTVIAVKTYNKTPAPPPS